MKTPEQRVISHLIAQRNAALDRLAESCAESDHYQELVAERDQQISELEARHLALAERIAAIEQKEAEHGNDIVTGEQVRPVEPDLRSDGGPAAGSGGNNVQSGPG